MSQEQPMSRTMAGRQQVRVRFDSLRSSPGLSAIGLPELIGLAGAAVIALLTIFAYFYFLVPANSRLTAAQLDRDRLKGVVNSSKVTFDTEISASATVKKGIASLEDFESNWLAAPNSGRMSLYSELNNLIRSNGVRNTSGPTYAEVPPLGTKTAVQPSVSAQQQTNEKWQTIYPGIAVSVTVEGPYQNVRHFVRDIEISRQFLVINAVELEGVTQQSGAIQDLSAMPVGPIGPRPSLTPARTARPQSIMPPTPVRGNSFVSLRLDLTTYFRRTDTERN
jgi:hypothetical protein